MENLAFAIDDFSDENYRVDNIIYVNNHANTWSNIRRVLIVSYSPYFKSFIAVFKF